MFSTQPSTCKTGFWSDMGEAVTMFPMTLPTFLICVPEKYFKLSRIAFNPRV